MAADLDKIRRENSTSDVARRFGVALQKDGNEFVACCPFHSEDTPSFTIFPGRDGIERFHCFGCDARGDVLDFVREIKGVGLREAVKILGGETDAPNVAPKQMAARDVYEGITPIAPAGEIRVGDRVRLYNPKRAGHEWEWGSFTPSAVYPYRSSGGDLKGYVLRREFRDGGKETPMVMWCRLKDGTETWCRYPLPKPRSLYGIEDLRAGQVIVVEGEKCRDKLRAATGRNVVSWAGGTHGVAHADWSPLAGRSVVIWPDADGPGVTTALRIAAILHGLDCTVKIVNVPNDKPEGWDCADAIDDGWIRDDLDGFMRANVHPWSPDGDDDGPAGGEPSPPATEPARPVAQAITTQQAEPATVTQLHTRKTVRADDAWTMGLICNEEGKIKPGVTKNWGLFLEHHHEMAGVFVFDRFKRSIVLDRCPPWEEADGWAPRAIMDRDYSEAVMWLEGHYMTPKASNIAAVIQTVAEHNAFDRLDEYLNGIEWDGKPRVDRFLVGYMGAADTDYSRAVSRRWLISAVARALKPGCKVDTMPVFEGTQGLFKSTALRVLFGDEFFTDEISDIGSKDAMMELQGVWCIEISEMQRFTASSVDNVKKFLSRQVDRYRPPYGRSVIDAPRRCILGGTMNPEGNAYLKDTTGARRFWPVAVGRIDLDAIARDRDQIWAEAVQLYLAGEPWWVQEGEQEAVVAEQAKRIEVDVWAEIIAPKLETRSEVSQIEIMEFIGIEKRHADTRSSSRIGRIMKSLGWETKRSRRGGRDETLFVNPKFADDQEDIAW